MRPLIVLLAMAVAGCGWSKVDTMEEIQPTGTAFDKGLYKGYVKLAKQEAKEEDWRDATAFADRAITAASGKAVLPEKLSARALPKHSVGDLGSARSRLTTALFRGGRNVDPKNASKAQVGFDCWMQEQEENHQPKHIKKCRDGFLKSMAKLEAAIKKKAMVKMMPMPKPAKPMATKAQYVVYFHFDSTKITPSGRRTLDQALRWAKNKRLSQVRVKGHTDRAGPKTFNAILAKKRARTVTNFLERGGIRANTLKSYGLGETSPAVQTADGKREARNRRVEISFTR